MSDKIEKQMAEEQVDIVLTEKKGKKEKPSIYREIPDYRVKCDLSSEQQERLLEQFEREFKALKDERSKLKLEDAWKSLDNQYNGEVKRNPSISFNLHCYQSKIKENAIVRALNEAFLDSDPIVDITPRPENLKNGGQDVCDRQAQFIDYEMDENIRPAHNLILINHDAVRKYVGIGKLEWLYKKDRRKREEVYEGKWEPEVDDKGNPITLPNGQPRLNNKALKEFLGNYPDAEERYPDILKKIAKGEKVSLIVDYMDIVNNNANLKHIPIEDFFVCNSCDRNHGLNSTHLIVERQSKRWFELMDKVKSDEFDDDAVQSIADGEDYDTKDYTIYEATTYFKMDEEDEEEVKIKAWFADSNSIEGKVADNTNQSFTLLGVIDYPYFGFDTDYIAFFVDINGDGFYGAARSVTHTLKDSNIAQDAILNLSLHSAFIRNILTPIVREGSEIEAQFIENRWRDGKPLVVDQMTEDVSKAMGFVQYPQFDLGGLTLIRQDLKRTDGDITGVTDLMTGRESQTDPRAPASKTIALLNQSGINIKDYIRIYLPSFNLFIEKLFALYYQMSKEGKKFRVNAKGKEVTGSDGLFNDISRDQLIARTTVQARASAFAFDKVNEAQADMNAYGMVSTNPYLMTQPELQFEALRTVLSAKGGKWKAFAEKMLDPKQFEEKQMMVAQQAVQGLMQKKQFESQATGLPPQVNPQEAGDAVTQAQTMAFHPELNQEKK